MLLGKLDTAPTRALAMSTLLSAQALQITKTLATERMASALAAAKT